MISERDGEHYRRFQNDCDWSVQEVDGDLRAALVSVCGAAALLSFLVILKTAVATQRLRLFRHLTAVTDTTV